MGMCEFWAASLCDGYSFRIRRAFCLELEWISFGGTVSAPTAERSRAEAYMPEFLRLVMRKLLNWDSFDGYLYILVSI